jgi:predicted MFS family arabinose efflux permease
VGVVIAVMSSGGVVGALIATRVARRLGTARAMLLGQLGGAPFALLIPLAGGGARLALVMVGGFSVGTGVTVGNVIKSSFRQMYAPRHLLGRVVTGMQFVNYGAIPLGALLGGLLGTALGLRPTMWLMAVLLVLATGILLVGPLRHRRDLPEACGARPAASNVSSSISKGH